MKQSSRLHRIFLLILTIVLTLAIASPALAAASIDVSAADLGSFSVNYGQTGGPRMKVGLTFNGSTKYFDYTPGGTATYSFVNGSGDYTVDLYRNLSGTSYTKVDSCKVKVAVDANAQYLVSTTEIAFSAKDAVGLKAAVLCNGSQTDAAKVTAIYIYIAANFSFDQAFADDILAGRVTTYTPSTAATLNTQKGVCYDLSALFAALCRSQNIPCALVKGQYNGGAHAWNQVLVDGAWHNVDLTYAVQFQAQSTLTLADCWSPLAYANADSGLVVTAI